MDEYRFACDLHGRPEFLLLRIDGSEAIQVCDASCGSVLAVHPSENWHEAWRRLQESERFARL
jgi:hypothetical protein